MRIAVFMLIFCGAAGVVEAQDASCAYAPRKNWIKEDRIARIMSDLGATDYTLAVEDGCIEVNFMLRGAQFEARIDPVTGRIVETFPSYERRM